MANINNSVIKVLILYLMIPTVLSECKRRRIIHTIQYMDCLPKRVMTFVCSGKCTSSVRPSPTGTGGLEQFCECCQESDSVTRHARLLCPNTHEESPFKSVIVPLTIPLVCVCQRCTFSSSESESSELNSGISHTGKRANNTINNIKRRENEVLKDKINSD